MDERLAGNVRRDLADLLDGVHGRYPDWTSSPASARVAAEHDASMRRPGELGRRWAVVVAIALAALLLLASGLFLAGALRLVGLLPRPRPSLVQLAMPRHPRDLVPTGAVTAPSLVYPQLVADAEGAIWGLGGGQLTRFDPGSEAATHWSTADDAVFASSAMIAAPGRGVWLMGDTSIAWFDGERLRDVVPAPGTVTSMAMAADESLWAATEDRRVVHWDGRSWIDVEHDADLDVIGMRIDANGGVWTAEATYPGPACRGMARYDGTAWTRHTGADAAPLARCVVAMAVAPDGSLWAATEGGVAAYDGHAWTSHRLDDHRAVYPSALVVGPDGTAWLAGTLAVADGSPGEVIVISIGGRGARTDGPADGLPDGVSNGWSAVGLAATDRGVFVGTGAGLFRLTGDRWVRAFPPTDVASGPTWPLVLAAVSGDEAWASSSQGLWHWWSGGWSLSSGSEGLPAAWTAGPWGVLDSSAGGVVWAAGDHGVAIRDGPRWTVLTDQAARAIAFGIDGTAWIGGADPGDIRSYRLDGREWTPGPVLDSPFAEVSSLAVDRDGTLWATARPIWGADPAGAIARFDGTSWVPERPVEQGGCVAGDLAVALDGAVWVALGCPAADGSDPVTRAARFDGTTWVVYGEPDGLAPLGDRHALAAAPDGGVWAATQTGAQRFDGRRWIDVGAGGWSGPIDVAPDGAVWVITDGTIRQVSPALTTPATPTE